MSAAAPGPRCPTRPFGTTGIEMPVLSCGGMRHDSQAALDEIVDRAMSFVRTQAISVATCAVPCRALCVLRRVAQCVLCCAVLCGVLRWVISVGCA